jgi:hypothetical protein
MNIHSIMVKIVILAEIPKKRPKIFVLSFHAPLRFHGSSALRGGHSRIPL